MPDFEGPKLAVLIPARFDSSRLPGKPLRSIAGKPLVLWVYEQAARTSADFVAVATDDPRIGEVVERAGGCVVMTRSDHASGTDRLAEVVEQRRFDPECVVVNLQGDEPLISPHAVMQLADCLIRSPEADLATLATPLTSARDAANPNIVKVVTDKDGRALYFSRSPIPFARETPTSPTIGAGSCGLRHVGLYAYRARTLRSLASHPQVYVEQCEALEQLRALWLGFRCVVHTLVEAPAHGVDTEEDLVRVERELLARA